MAHADEKRGPSAAGAMELLRTGRADEAIAICREGLRVNPDDAAAHCALGVAFAMQRKPDEAIAAFRAAVKIRPDFAEAYNNLGAVLGSTRLNDAIAAFRTAVTIKPDYTDAQVNLADALQAGGRPDEAIAPLRAAAVSAPRRAELHLKLAKLLLARGKPEEALVAFRAVVALKPDDGQSQSTLGGLLCHFGRYAEAIAPLRAASRLTNDGAVYNNLGSALRLCNRLDESLDAYQNAVRLKPDFSQAHSNLGKALLEIGRIDEAIASQQTAIKLAPNHPDAYASLGLALNNAGRFDESLAAYDNAIRIDPAHAGAHSHRATTLRSLGRLDEALDEHRAALTRDPNNADLHCNFALTLLTRGDLAQGFSEYEWRTKSRSFDSGFRSEKPRWDGGALNGRTLLIHAEQGIGDSIQFIRYAPLLAARGVRVVAKCQQPLARLFTTVGGVQTWVVGDAPLPPFDVHCPMMSLPAMLGTTSENVPNAVPYIRAEETLVSHWRDVLGGAQRLSVGLVWRGNPDHKQDRQRSISAEAIAPLASAEGVRFVSLQRFAAPMQKALPPGMKLLDPTDDLRDFADTAALIANLDLVITVDTAVAHLAGAMGKPVWTLLAFAPDWRWMLDREDSPWYPTMRLFRQTKPGDWAEVIERVRTALNGWRDARCQDINTRL